MKNEIILYQANELAERIEVRINDDTVWLTQEQISLLFGRDVKTIGKHIANVLHEELKGFSVVAKFATTTKHVASLKDLGKKWFAFSKINKDSVAILNSILEIL